VLLELAMVGKVKRVRMIILVVVVVAMELTLELPGGPHAAENPFDDLSRFASSGASAMAWSIDIIDVVCSWLSIKVGVVVVVVIVIVVVVVVQMYDGGCNVHGCCVQFGVFLVFGIGRC